MSEYRDQPELGDLADSPEAAQLLRNRQELSRLLSSPESRQLLAMLQRQAGDGLRQAAQAALQGDGSQLAALMERVTASSEGARAVERIQDRMSRK